MDDIITIDSMQLSYEPIIGREYEDPSIERFTQRAAEKIRKKRLSRGTKKWLEAQIRKYPEVPIFRNYLAVCYKRMNQEEAFLAEIKQTLIDFPDYLFGRLMNAEEALKNNDLDTVEQLLGKEMSLAALYPDKQLFHVSEYLTYQNMVVKYLLARDEPDEARERLETMLEVSEDHNTTREAEFRILQYGLRKMENFADRDLRTIGGAYDRSVQTEEAPQFHHQEIHQLYKNGIRIDHNLLHIILALPRKTLIKDLETALLDSLNRYEYFVDETDLNGWDEEKHNFSLHALFLLAELEASESLSTVLHILKQGDEFLEYWFSDFTTEQFWTFLYNIGKDQLGALRDFVLEDAISTLGKIPVFQMLTQLGLHQPERESEIKQWVKEVGQYFLLQKDNKALIDQTITADLIMLILDLKLEGLDGIVEQLYKENLVDLAVLGDWKDYLKEKERPIKDWKTNEIKNIFESYKHIIKIWYSDRDTSTATAPLKTPFPQLPENSPLPFSPIHPEGTFRRDGAKIGRNDPCPCGSGKKYKKCCLNK